MSEPCPVGHEFAGILLPTEVPRGPATGPGLFSCACGAMSVTVTSQHVDDRPPPIEAVVVASRAHAMTYAGTCFDCGQDARVGQCRPTSIDVASPRFVYSQWVEERS